MKPTVTASILERGILTSSYKQEIKKNIRNTKLKSLSDVKSLMLNHQGSIESQAGTILRVSFFVIAILMISF